MPCFHSSLPSAAIVSAHAAETPNPNHCLIFTLQLSVAKFLVDSFIQLGGPGLEFFGRSGRWEILNDDRTLGLVVLSSGHGVLVLI